MVFAALVLWLRYVALPGVDGYRDLVVSQMEKASGMSVSVRAMSGHWRGLRPVLSLEGLALADRRGRAAFHLERAEATLSWWSLLGGEVRFHDVDFYRPDLELRRGADGLIYLADKPLNAAGPGDDGAFTEWLLAQPRLSIHDATLTWRDDFLGAPQVRLTEVEIAVRRSLGEHRAALTARPPPELAGRIDLRADVKLAREGTHWRGTGDAYLETLGADLGRLRAHLAVPEALRSGVGSLRVWLRFSPRGVEDVVGDLNMRDARAQLAADALPLELASISGRARYRLEADGFTFATEGLRLRLPSGVEATPGNFSLARSAPAGGVPRVQVRADGIDLKIAATLVVYSPLPRDIKDHVLRFAPRGRIADTLVAWSGADAGLYSIKGRFEDLAVNAVDALPGLAGVSGSIEGTEAGGSLRIAGRDARLDLARTFRAPLAFDKVEGVARWKRAGAGLEVAIEDAMFSNADGELRFAGTWKSLPGTQRPLGFLDIKGSIARGNLAHAADYIPNAIARPRDWLERSVTGESRRLEFRLKGDLWEFPFGGGSAGNFVLEGDVRNARLKYHPDWPSVDAIDGTLRLQNRRLEVRAERAAIFASPVRAATAVIDDLRAQPPLLVINGDIDTTGGDSVRFLRESPLASGPGAFTRAVNVEGPAHLKLHIDYPLSGTETIRVAGDYQFAGATASVSRMLAMRDLRGKLAFTENGIRAPELTGTLFGNPAQLAIATQPEGYVLATIDGRMDAVVLGAYVPEAIATRTNGAADWKARITTSAAGVSLSIASELKGLGVMLPEPFAKDPQEARTLHLDIAQLGQERELSTIAIGGKVFGRFSRSGAPGAERWQAVLKFGAPIASEPAREGLWLYGELASLDVDAWQAVFATPRSATGEQQAAAERAQGLELRGVDLNLGRVRYLGREFQQMRARLDRDGTQWSGRLASPLIAGDIDWNGAGRGRLIAKLDRFSIPEASEGARAAAQAEQSELPALDVHAARFDFRGRTLGSLELKAEPVGGEWRIDRLDIGAGHSKFTSTGVWRRTAAGSLTTLTVQLDATSLNSLFTVFGYGDYLKRGSGHLEGTLVWPGPPNEFSLSNLSGTLKVEAKGGQFAKIEPGAGKLLGLLSLQSLPRRAMFDFRDIFSEGFAFDRIHGDVKVARGILLTNDFEISGSSAFVNLSGEVSMPQETQALTMKVVPEVGEGMALAATVFGTPVLGLSTLLLSKLMKNPLGKAVSYEYQVTGSWDNPLVTRTSAPPARAAASVPLEATPAQAAKP
ncbi:MAG: YhdP family protein [Usitatibacter sp.]